jgi:hypothetical protein
MTRLAGYVIHDEVAAVAGVTPIRDDAGPHPTRWAGGQVREARSNVRVAPIALYPDPLLAQVLAASTDPLKIVLPSSE